MGQGNNRVDPERLYFTDEVKALFSVSDATLQQWAENGLKRLDRKKLAMKKQGYFGCHLLEFLRQNIINEG